MTAAADPATVPAADPATLWATVWHLGGLHPVEQLLVMVLAFGPFVVLGLVVASQRRRAIAAEEAEKAGQAEQPGGPAEADRAGEAEPRTGGAEDGGASGPGTPGRPGSPPSAP